MPPLCQFFCFCFTNLTALVLLKLMRDTMSTIFLAAIEQLLYELVPLSVCNGVEFLRKCKNHGLDIGKGNLVQENLKGILERKNWKMETIKM